MKNFDCLYSGASFEYDLSIKPDDSFNAKANTFIQALEANDKFETFHGLVWSTSTARYYVIS